MNNCLSCKSESLSTILDLGEQPLANNLLKPEDLGKKEPQFPLRLSVCNDCWLMQITDLVRPVDLFSDYLYFSSFSDQMLDHAAKAAHRYIQEFDLDEKSLVVEIASNDGYLLKNFVAENIPVLGIEPAANIAEVAEEIGVPSLVDFFGEKLAGSLEDEGKQADLILGNNVFAHAPDTNDFVKGLKLILKPRGRIILEFPYGVEFIDKMEFDTIYHEHVFYFTLTALLPLFERHGLSIHHVEKINIHGGSLRLFAGHSGDHNIEHSVEEMLDEETAKGVGSPSYYQDFSQRAQSIKEELLHLFKGLSEEGKTIAAYGASAKGSTLLNFVKPEPGTIEYIVDRSNHKQDRLSPGLHIPIVATEHLLEKQPDYTLLLTWNFADEIMEQQDAYRKSGGKFIIPIPEVHIQ